MNTPSFKSPLLMEIWDITVWLWSFSVSCTGAHMAVGSSGSECPCSAPGEISTGLNAICKFNKNCYIVATLAESNGNHWDCDLHCPMSTTVDRFSFIGQLDFFFMKCLFKFLAHFYWTYSIYQRKYQHCTVTYATCIIYNSVYSSSCPPPSSEDAALVLCQLCPA